MPRLALEADLPQKVVTTRLHVGLRIAGAACLDGVEQRDADVVDEIEAYERPRQLKAARQTETGALMRRQAVEGLAGESHRSLLIAQSATNAIDECALARSVRTDQTQALAGRDRERDILQRNKSAEALAEVLYLEKVGCRAHVSGAHGTVPGASASIWRRRPTKSSGLR